jgi:hypothetical protein
VQRFRFGTFLACVPHSIATLFEGQNLCGPLGKGKVEKGKSSKITPVTISREKGLGFLSLFGKVGELFSFPSFPSRRGFETFPITEMRKTSQQQTYETEIKLEQGQR